MDQERWQWWQWHQKCYLENITWHVFSKSLCDRFDRESIFLFRLTKLRQIGTVNEYIAAFKALAFHTGGLHDVFYMECFVSGLKEAIQAHA